MALGGLRPAGWREVDESPTLGLVNDTSGPFPSRFAGIGGQYDALWGNAERGERNVMPRVPVLSSPVEEPGILERLLNAASTPLPRIREFTPEEIARFKAGLAGLLPQLPAIPQLPMAPQWLLDYARSRGLDRSTTPTPPPLWQPAQDGQYEQLDPAVVQHYNEYFGR